MAAVLATQDDVTLAVVAVHFGAYVVHWRLIGPNGTQRLGNPSGAKVRLGNTTLRPSTPWQPNLAVATTCKIPVQKRGFDDVVARYLAHK